MSLSQKIFLGLAVFIPVSLATHWFHVHPVLGFVLAGLGIVPLAAWIAGSTEEIATVIGPTFGGLLNATFGNATEMIIAIVALSNGLVSVVQASIAGSVIANLLLALGLAIFLGGLRFSEQKFPPAVARINASSLTLAVIVLFAPTAIQITSQGLTSATLLNFSHVAAGLLLLFYGLMLFFSLKTHRSIYQLEEIEAAAESPPDHHPVNLKLQVGILLGCTIVLVFVSETLVYNLEQAIDTLHFTDLFTGVILIPIFGGVVEYITCISFALNNKMEVAVSVAIGSSLQIALFMAPVLVLAGWVIGQPMGLDFNLFEVIAVAMAVVITNSISTDGNCNWLEGTLLLITYAVLGVAFYVHP